MSVCLYVCLYVCMFVCMLCACMLRKATQKRLDNFYQNYGMGGGLYVKKNNEVS